MNDFQDTLKEECQGNLTSSGTVPYFRHALVIEISKQM